MKMNLTINSLRDNLPAFLIIIPMLSSICILLVARRKFARVFFVATNFVLVCLSILLILNFTETKYYIFGNWERPIGIEFKIDHLSIYSVSMLYVFCCLFSIFCFSALKERLEILMQSGKEHIPYVLFLLVETGYCGILLTNDVFNLYVFLELASLATYPLIAMSLNKGSLISAFEYLIIGTLSAIFILVSIGFILGIVGSLNLSDINLYFKENGRDIKYILTFLIIGILIKISVFPLHRWKIKSYANTSPIILCFFLNISVLCSIVALLKFSPIIELSSKYSSFYIQIVGYGSVIFSSILVFREINFRNIIIFSSISSVGYYLTLWPFNSVESYLLLTKLLIVDGFVKLGLILVVIAVNKEDLSVSNFNALVGSNRYISYITTIILFVAAALPPSQAFFNKLAVFRYILIDKNSEIESIMPVMLLSCCSFLFLFAYCRIAMNIFKIDEVGMNFSVNNIAVNGMATVAIILLLVLFCFQNPFYEFLI